MASRRRPVWEWSLGDHGAGADPMASAAELGVSASAVESLSSLPSRPFASHAGLLSMMLPPREARSAAVVDREARSAAVLPREARSAAVLPREARSAAVVDRSLHGSAPAESAVRAPTHEAGPALPLPGGRPVGAGAPSAERAAAPRVTVTPVVTATAAGSAGSEDDETARTLRELARLRARGGATALCGAPGGEPAGPPFVVRGHTFSARWVERTLHGVIANACQSKTYNDILPLDGGTVGISHFASGSLRILYTEMDVERYFGVPASRIPERPYHLSWWREGMRRFLQSREGRLAQQRAWRTFISPALGQALDHGWASERHLAIAAGIANSLGTAGFTALAQGNRWDAERTLLSYARLSSHKERRRQRLNYEFPPAPAGAPAGFDDPATAQAAVPTARPRLTASAATSRDDG